MRSTPVPAHRETPAHIGVRLRGARRARGLTIQQVAVAVGRTKSFISRLERDEVSPSVASLVAVCDVLGISVGALFEVPTTQLVRHGEATPINFGGDGVEEYVLTPGAQTMMQVIRSTIAAQAASGPEPCLLQCDAEFVHVMRGELEIELAEEIYRLQAGDSLSFSGREPRTWRNPHPRNVAHVLWVMVPAP